MSHRAWPPLSFCDMIKVNCLHQQNPNKFDFWMSPESRMGYVMPFLFTRISIIERNNNIFTSSLRLLNSHAIQSASCSNSNNNKVSVLSTNSVGIGYESPKAFVRYDKKKRPFYRLSNM